MDIPTAIARDLALLSQALDDPSVDLAARLTAFASSVGHAVPSYLGLTLLLPSHPESARLTVASAPGVGPMTVRSSLLIPRPRPDTSRSGAGDDGVGLVLYAEHAGAFDLAADVARLTGTDLGDVVMDGHLSPSPDSTTALARQSTIHEAIGVLIARGRTPGEASADLDTRAAGDRTDRWSAAVRLLEGLEAAGSSRVPGGEDRKEIM